MLVYTRCSHFVFFCQIKWRAWETLAVSVLATSLLRMSHTKSVLKLKEFLFMQYTGGWNLAYFSNKHIMNVSSRRLDIISRGTSIEISNA